MRAIAIALAIIGAAALAFGTQFQNDAVGDQQGKKSALHGSLNFKQILKLLRNRKWLTGGSMIAGALVLQITALTLAPLIVVQPLGAIALVITSLLNARVSKTRLNRATIIAVSLCVIGVGLFVAMASTIAHEIKLTDALLWQVLITLFVIVIVFGTMFLRSRGKAKAITYIIGAGVLYGFVATLMKVVIQRIQQGQFEWLTIFCAVVLLAASVMGGWFVQNAYSSGPPDLVIAGLTVIDPMVAVLIAAVILREAGDASPLILLGFVFSGGLAITGVALLSHFHPQILLAKRKAALWSRKRTK